MLGHLLEVNCVTWWRSVVPSAESKVCDTVEKCCEFVKKAKCVTWRRSVIPSAESKVCDTVEKYCEFVKKQSV